MIGGGVTISSPTSCSCISRIACSKYRPCFIKGVAGFSQPSRIRRAISSGVPKSDNPANTGASLPPIYLHFGSVVPSLCLSWPLHYASQKSLSSRFFPPHVDRRFRPLYKMDAVAAVSQPKRGAPHPMNGKTKELSKPELKERLEQLRSRVPRAVLIPIPYDADQTIIVRAHWRRGRNHLSKYPELRQAWQREVGR